MREVEGDGHARHRVGREPFVRQPEVRLEVGQAVRLEFTVQLGDTFGEHARLDADAQLAHPQIQQLLVRPLSPLLGREYRRRCHPSSVAAPALLSRVGAPGVVVLYPYRLILSIVTTYRPRDEGDLPI
jgi:hypothetical protein